MNKRLLVILQDDPMSEPERVNDALRYVGAALAQDMDVRLHLLRDAVQLARSGRLSGLDELLEELTEVGLAVSACGKSLGDAEIGDEDLRSSVERASMKALAQWSAESDLMVTF